MDFWSICAIGLGLLLLTEKFEKDKMKKQIKELEREVQQYEKFKN